MAFQTGTKVDPRLMRADLSGFSRGTELAMAGIGAAIKGYAAKKKENEQINFAAESLAGQAKENPYVRQLFGLSEAEAESVTAADLKPIVKGYGAKTALGLSAQINLLTTKAEVTEAGGKSKRARMKSFYETLKNMNLEDVGGKLRYNVKRAEKFEGSNSKTDFTAADVAADGSLSELKKLYPDITSTLFPEQFGSASITTGTELDAANASMPQEFIGIESVTRL